MEEIELADEVGLGPSWRRRAPPARLRRVGAGRGARRSRDAHEADPPDQRRHRAQLGRSGAGVPGVRDRRPALRRPRPRSWPGAAPSSSRSALRLRPAGLRRALRREARPAARARTVGSVTWTGTHRAPLANSPSIRGSAGPAAHLGRGRRAGPRSAPAGSACRWRSRSSAAGPALRALRGAPPPRGPRGRPRAAAAPGINSHGYVADTAEQAAGQFFPPYAAMMNAIGAERGCRRSPGRTSTPSARCPARSSWGIRSRWSKILFQHDLFGHQRFLAQIGVGTLPARAGAAGDRAPRHGVAPGRPCRGRSPAGAGRASARDLSPTRSLNRPGRERPVSTMQSRFALVKE